ncbi:5-methylcytosine-specific restriction enzyme subunit McrC [Nocardioides thalensis]|uniref:5-methylcytosine-specific restriction enzyme subunit McrC n=1 Tax=Nocardioides thalensis TaxID=1914755 RepID=A0A853C7H0_9ACTN|nr:restriction endonuclease [Nocardioides thalensis]NYJ02428.1 5-methylcytosine-specific restriction enzyme subunit McrC [Nocardioides thalensis]
MDPLTLTEGEPAKAVRLSNAEAEALGSAELAVVTRAPGSDDWFVAAGTKVGVVRVGQLQVSIQPKISIDRLVFLMGYATKPKFWRNHSVLLDVESDLPEALAHAFTRLAGKAVEQGLLQGYKTVDDSLPVLRGRIRVRDQISHRYGIGLPLEVTYDDFTVDIPENQILLATTIRLLRMANLSAPVRQRLQRLRLQLAVVTELGRGDMMPDWQATRLNTRYQPALHLAALILAGDSFEQRVGDLEVSGFVFDMWKIYEDFVSVALREAMTPFGGSASLQHRMYLDEADQVEMRPDFLWTTLDGRRIVVDAKYKAEKPAGFPQADLYQLLAYCTVLGLSEGHLVYAAGNELAVEHAVRGAEVAITCHTLDLDQPPERLLEQVGDLASRLIA